MGLNAEVIEIDAEKHILYVKDMDEQEPVFGADASFGLQDGICKR